MNTEALKDNARTADALDPRQVDRVFLLAVAIASLASLVLALLN